jgi:hypothetical protein
LKENEEGESKAFTENRVIEDIDLTKDLNSFKTDKENIKFKKRRKKNRYPKGGE